MRGFISILLTWVILSNLLLAIGVIVISYQINDIHYISIYQIIFNLKTYYYNYIFNSDYFMFYQLLFMIANSFIFIFGIKNRRYINMAYALDFVKKVKDFGIDKKSYTNNFDFFLYKKKRPNGYSLYYFNLVSIDLKDYEKKLDEITQYLNWNGEIQIKKFGSQGVEIYLYNLPTLINFNQTNYTKNKIYLGESINGKAYIPLEQLTSLICVGSSGAGKSTCQHHLIFSLLTNIDLVEKFYMIDLKGTELNLYNVFENVHFSRNLDEVKLVMNEVNKEMNRRFQEMQKNNLRISKEKYIYVIIDEVGTIGTSLDKKLKDEIFSLMTEIAQKGRACKILLLIFAQKLDSANIPTNVLTNLQSKILMRTDSDFNLNQTIGTKDDLKKITNLDISDFPKGRLIFKNGITSEKTLIQSPWIDV